MTPNQATEDRLAALEVENQRLRVELEEGRELREKFNLTAFHEGYGAAESAKLDDNPHEYGTARYQSWLAGYLTKGAQGELKRLHNLRADDLAFQEQLAVRIDELLAERDRLVALEAENQRLRAEANHFHRVIGDVTDKAVQSLEELRAERDRLFAALLAITDAAGPIVCSDQPGRLPLTPAEVRVPSRLIVAARKLIGEDADPDADSAMETLIGPEEF